MLWTSNCIHGVFRLKILGLLKNVLLDKVVDVVEVATLANGVVVVTIWQLFPDSSFDFTESEQLLHVRWSRCRVSIYSLGSTW